MRIVNLAHGSSFMLGGYIGLSVVWRGQIVHTCSAAELAADDAVKSRYLGV